MLLAVLDVMRTDLRTLFKGLTAAERMVNLCMELVRHLLHYGHCWSYKRRVGLCAANHPLVSCTLGATCCSCPRQLGPPVVKWGHSRLLLQCTMHPWLSLPGCADVVLMMCCLSCRPYKHWKCPQ